MRTSLVVVGALVAGFGPAAAQSPALANLDFMAGCWNGDVGPGLIVEEHWTQPTVNVILGTTRYIAGDSTTSWEFSLIEAGAAGVIMTPHPSGQAPVPYRLTRGEKGIAVFENPEHDFPKVIAYRRAADTLVARVAGVRRQGTVDWEWRMTPVACR